MKSKLIKKAEKLARKWHKGQMRKWGGLDYITHPISVAKGVKLMVRALSLSDNLVEQVICLALLHDTIEDNYKDREIVYSEICLKINPVVAERVKVLTREPETSYNNYIDSLVCIGHLTELVVKYCDIMHNLSTLPLRKKGMQERYHKSLIRIYGAIVQRMTVKNYIFD